jgi:hypothetical protein
MIFEASPEECGRKLALTGVPHNSSTSRQGIDSNAFGARGSQMLGGGPQLPYQIQPVFSLTPLADSLDNV